VFHVLLVRIKGVVPPFEKDGAEVHNEVQGLPSRRGRSRVEGRLQPYDIIKEGIIAVVIVSILTVLLAIAFGSPDDPSITVKAWSTMTRWTLPRRRSAS